MPYDSIERQRARTTARAATRALASLGLMLASIVVGLFLLEIGARLLRGPEALGDWRNLVMVDRIEGRRQQERDAVSAYRHDPRLGFVNNPGYTSEVLNFDDRGFRRMPPLAADARRTPPILATGDSFTKGDEVGDLESWPAFLQDVLNWRTINAGVGAYGLDQTVLLTEQLVAQEKPAVLVLGFIADDVRRAEMSRLWGREKPYFQPVGSEARLRNVPVPQPRDPRATLTPVQWAFGWSVLLDTVLDRLRLRNAWHTDEVRALSSGAGERLACPLMRRVAALGAPTLVVAQYLPSAWDVPESAAEERRVTQVVLDCAAKAGLGTLDLWQPFDVAIDQDGRHAVYNQWHPNGRGYRLTAEAIAAALRRAKLAP